jgi:AcrR family transcriptional regulator
LPKVSEAHLEARREQIIDAAITCFARDGFHRTTMQDIVKAGSLSPGAIYSYFASKEEIIEAIAGGRHRREREWLTDASELDDPRAALAATAKAFFGGLSGRRARLDRRVGVFMWAEALRNPRIRRLARGGVDQPLIVLIQVIEDAQARGQVSPGLDPESLARAMIALFHGLVLQQAWDETVDVERYLDTIEQLLVAITERR